MSWRERFQPGYRLGTYVLLETLGHGGQGVVWSGWDARRERVVALKIIPVAVDDPLSNPRAFEQEVRLIADLDHPSILPLYDFGSLGQYRYFSTRYICSGSLQDLLRLGPIPPQDALRLAAQIASALNYIHSRRIVHRDLKPSNILLDTQKRVQLTDFGLARQLSDTTQRLHTGHGTRLYAPPEQLTRAHISTGSDIYSLGIVLYEMLTGSLPWDGETALSVQQLDSQDELPDPRDINPTLPAALASALRALTAADPADRPPSMADAFGLVARALRDGGKHDATHDESLLTLEDALPKVSPHLDDEALAVEDARYIMQHFSSSWEPDTERFKLGLTDFALVDSIYAKAERHKLTLDDTQRQFMLRGALVHGRNVDSWWQKVDGSQARLQVCEWAILNEGEAAVARTLGHLLSEPTVAFQIKTLSEPTIRRLINLAAEAEDAALRDNALSMLSLSIGKTERWRPAAFPSTGDAKLVALALSDSPEAKHAARLIGQARSETAVQALLDAREERGTAHVLPALMEMRDIAGSLPRSTPAPIRLRVVIELARRQLFADRAALFRAYIAASLGSALGLGLHTYMTYRVPRFLDAARILNALGGGLLFGLLIGLGIFLTRLIVHRLRALPLVPRMALGIGIGALVVNLGTVGYHDLFLAAAPRGGLVAMSSAFTALGFGLGEGLIRLKPLRALTSIATIGLGLALSWRVALYTPLTPVLYYETGRPIQTVLLTIVTSLLIGSIAHLADL